METGRMGRKLREETAFLFDESIVAKPLVAAGIDNIVQKNKNVYLKWVNWQFQSGIMYEMAKAKGFVNALVMDAEVPGVLFKDGVLKYGDLILMKIGLNIALSAQKADTLRAMNQSGAKQDAANHRRHLADALNEVGEPTALKAKIQAFTPSEKEASALVGGP